MAFRLYIVASLLVAGASMRITAHGSEQRKTGADEEGAVNHTLAAKVDAPTASFAQLSVTEILQMFNDSHAAAIHSAVHGHQVAVHLEEKHHAVFGPKKKISGLGRDMEAESAMMSNRLLIVCFIVIGSLISFWGIYAALSKIGRDVPALKLTLLCLSFGACSWGMNVLNKALVSVFHAPSLVTAAQMLMTVFGTLILAFSQLKGTKEQMLKWSFVPFLFFGMLVSSFFTYEYLTLSMLMVIRNLSPMLTLPIEKLVMPVDKQPVVSGGMLSALMVILVGAMVYVGHAPETSAIGFVFSMLNMVLAIADRVAQRRLLTSECKDLSTETCVLLNNVIGCVPCIALGAVMGELRAVDMQLWFQSRTTLLLVLSGVIGSGICYTAIAVQREISATSLMVLQNTARMFVVVAGIIIFKDPAEPHVCAGLVLSFAGAIWYGHCQMEANRKAKEAAAMAAGDDEKQKSLAK